MEFNTNTRCASTGEYTRFNKCDFDLNCESGDDETSEDCTSIGFFVFYTV